MFRADDRPLRARIDRYRAGAALVLASLIVLIAASAPPAVAAAGPTVPAGFTITKLANSPANAKLCDDLTFLDGHLYLGCQNKTLSAGGGGDSTLAEYGLDGTLVKTWTIKDKIDGMSADPNNHRLVVTLDEDANSHLITVAPAAAASNQIVNYAYSPDPHAFTTTGLLHTSGGTDQVNVDANGNILITGSHSLIHSGTGVFRVVLTPPSSPTGTGTAALSPTYSSTFTAPVANGSGTVHESLGDQDSAAPIPQDSPRFGGGYVVTDQTALILVFVNNIFNGTGLSVMKLKTGLDDLLWTTSTGGTLYVANLVPTNGAPAIYKVTGPFAKNTVLASNDGISDQVDTLNLTTGAETPFVRGLTTTKGLVYLNPDGTHTAVTLNGGATAASTKTTTGHKKSSGSSNTGLIIGIIAAVIVIVGVGGYALMRRRSAG
jgi:hypothetical protein